MNLIENSGRRFSLNCVAHDLGAFLITWLSRIQTPFFRRASCTPVLQVARRRLAERLTGRGATHNLTRAAAAGCEASTRLNLAAQHGSPERKSFALQRGRRSGMVHLQQQKQESPTRTMGVFPVARSVVNCHPLPVVPVSTAGDVPVLGKRWAERIKGGSRRHTLLHTGGHHHFHAAAPLSSKILDCFTMVAAALRLFGDEVKVQSGAGHGAPTVAIR